MLEVFRRKKESNTLQAYLDTFNNNILYGWALDTKDTNRKLRLEVLIDDEVVTTIVANEFRPDLKEVFGGDGKYAFSCPLDLVFHRNQLGKVTLRDLDRGIMLPVNQFSVKYDLSKLTANSKSSSLAEAETLSDLSKFTKVLDYYHLKEFEKAKRTAENLLKKENNTPSLIYEKLLSIYLSEENYISALELYYSVQRNSEKETLFITLNKLMLEHCSSLWTVSSIPEYLSAQDIHKLEILMIILDNTYMITSKIKIEKVDNIESFYLYSLKSGMLLSANNIHQLITLLVDEAMVSLDLKEKTDLYISILPFAKRLHTVIHTVDLTALSEIHHFFDKGLREERESEYMKLLVHLYFNYVIVLINGGELTHKNTVNTILYMVHKLSKKYEIQTIQFYSILMSLYYNLGDYHQSLKIFIEYGIENIMTLDWNCKYLSQLIWLHFKHNKYTTNEEIKEFLYQKQSEGRTTFLENIILLSDIYRWKKNTNINLMYILVKDLTFGYFTEKNEEVHYFVKKMLKKISYGTLNMYYNNSENIQNYLNKNIKLPLVLHQTEFFEFQNLYTLSLLNNAQETITEIKIDKKKYQGLLSRNIKYTMDDFLNKKVEKRDMTIVFSVADDRYETSFLFYYQSMLAYSKMTHIILYIWFSKYFYRISFQENNVVTEKFDHHNDDLQENLSKESNSYLILGNNSVIHHQSFELFQVSNIHYSSLLSDSESFLIDYTLFQYFQQKFKYKSYKCFIDSLFKIKIALSDLRQYEQNTFKELEQGIISYESIDSEAISRLTNYRYSIFELDDIEKSLQYLTKLYTDERIEQITNININDVSMILLKESKSKSDKLACFLVQRNEYLRMEGFLQYYREMGVDTFYIIDNGSDDGLTLDFLLDQEDVTVYSTIQAYSQSLYGVKWIELLIQAKRIGKWNLVVDADELLFLDEKYPTFKELCKELDEEGYDSIYTPFLDMYSNESINYTKYSLGREILNTCAYYDKHFYTSFTMHGGIRGEFNTYQGGIRSRAFGLYSVVLNKFPLFKFHPKQKLREGLHWIDNARPAYAKAILLHFKYIETFHQYVMSEIKRGQHWNGASEYRQYYHFLAANPTFSLYNPTLSVKFTSVKDFYDNLFEPYHLGEKYNV